MKDKPRLQRLEDKGVMRLSVSQMRLLYLS